MGGRGGVGGSVVGSPHWRAAHSPPCRPSRALPSPLPCCLSWALSLFFTSGDLCSRQTDGLFCLILFGLCHI